MEKNSKNTSVKKLLIASGAVLLCLLVAAAVFFAVHKNNNKEEDPAVADLIAAYLNADRGYTKFPEDSGEAYALVLEKLRSMPYERVCLDGKHSLALEAAAGELSDKQLSAVENSAKTIIEELNSSFDPVAVDFGGETKGFLPDVSSLSPLSVEAASAPDGKYVIALKLSKKDAETLVAAEDKASFEKLTNEKLFDEITFSSAAASVKDGTVEVEFDVYNSFVSKIETKVNYNVNLDCIGEGKLKDIGEKNVLFSVSSVTELRSSREGVYFEEKTLRLPEGSSRLLGFKLMLSPQLSTDDYSIKLVSSDSSAVTVDGDGKVTAVKNTDGPVEVNIYLNISGGNSYHDTCEVYVTVPVKSVKLSQKTLSLEKGKTAALSASVKPENATDGSVVWLSSDESIASVSSDGTVTGVGEGSTKIVALSADGLSYAVCEVTVE
ncbi:MAG: Ig domain-containing protein [Clostridia bacterium]|nr:Ig domain-containing protein [Clostridia bacterium]